MSDQSTAQVTRLQIGMSTPGALPDEALSVFFDSTWLNLGDPPLENARPVEAPTTLSHNGKQFVKRALRAMNAGYDGRCRSVEKGRAARTERIAELNRSPFYKGFWWEANSRLEFADGAFSFIFSEHFFEHIWPHEAYPLFRECGRILRPGGVLRVSVPDADLRTYEAPEPFAFDTATFTSSIRGWQHPGVHKTRWNIYLLTLLLSQAGFKVRPIVYCDKHGKYFSSWPQRGDSDYPAGADWEVVGSKRYLIRTENSLIVDAIKTCA